MIDKHLCKHLPTEDLYDHLSEHLCREHLFTNTCSNTPLRRPPWSRAGRTAVTESRHGENICRHFGTGSPPSPRTRSVSLYVIIESLRCVIHEHICTLFNGQPSPISCALVRCTPGRSDWRSDQRAKSPLCLTPCYQRYHA